MFGSKISHVSARVCPVKIFQSSGVLPLDQPEQWLAPQSYNQGSYDVVFIKLCELNVNDITDISAKEAGFDTKMLVRFVQVTRSETHSFVTSYFTDFLCRLAMILDTSAWIYAVEVCFVVPVAIMDQFRLPTNDVDVYKEILDSAFRSTAPHFLSPSVISTRVDVQVVEVEYNMFGEMRKKDGEGRGESAGGGRGRGHEGGD